MEGVGPHPHHADLCAAALQAAEAELRRAVAAKDELLARVSHELRTPLTVVTGFGQALLTHGDRLDEEARRECLRAIVQSAWRLEHLITELLDAARLDDGMAVPRPRDVTVAELAATALTTARWRHRPTLAGGGDVTVYADPDQLTAALVHLLVNAERYGAPPVRIHGRTGDDGRAEITVSDAGPGVPEAFVPRLFERFEQASTGDRRDASGVGLGLYLVRTLVETNHGTVTYEPGADGGACFVLRLPAGVREVALPEVEPGGTPPTGRGGGRRPRLVQGTLRSPSTSEGP